MKAMADLGELVKKARLGEGEAKKQAHQELVLLAEKQGIYPSSIQPVYEAMGRGEIGGFTTPAINIRGLTFEVSRAIFEVAQELEAGFFIFEIARSEIGYTLQRPHEYSACILAAAIEAGWRGPVFIQGDHFQVNAKKFKEDREKELKELRQLMAEAVSAGFYNIDIDTSTLVDLSQPDLKEQQRLNYEVGVELHRYLRGLEQGGVTISIGGEIGEVGGKNSTPEELIAYMEGYRALLPRGMKGISKISVQTGTTHGGVVLPDGSLAKVKVDFETLKTLSELARTRYGLAGAVQHGASTLPEELFDHFPRCGACEIHLATEFQNVIYKHLPEDLIKKIYAFLDEKCNDERKPDMTPEQFYYKTRKKGLGPFKKELSHLPQTVLDPLLSELKNKFRLLFTKLGVGGTAKWLPRYYSRV
jgi:fructose/tagatose bisphosphate aldolase